MNIQQRLFQLRDGEYQAFQAKLIPNIAPELIIGVRTPELRALAKELYGSPEGEEFLRALPHEYFEEDQLHAFLICEIKDYGKCMAELQHFLPYVDNWATCDQLSPPAFKKHLPELKEEIRLWLSSGRTYTVRFGAVMLMRHFLDCGFSPEQLYWIADIDSEEYYVKMAAAWYFATALAKQYDSTLPILEEQRLDKWTHNRSIQKAVESLRLSGERKAYLRSLKRK